MFSPDYKTYEYVTGFRVDPMTVVGGGIKIPGTDRVIRLLEVRTQTHYVGGFKYDLSATPTDVRVQLLNPLLRRTCSIGTTGDPLKLRMKPDGGIVFHPAPGGGTIIEANSKDNTFAVPAISGCGVLTNIINKVAKLPSPGGQNEAKFHSYVQFKSYSELFPRLRTRTK